MTTEQNLTIRVSHQYDSPAEQVFDAFLDPTKAAKFMFATDTGEMIRAEIDPQVGGSFVFVDRRPEGDAEHYGTFLDIDRPQRLQFVFSVDEQAAESDLITIEFSSRAKSCEVTLTHELKPQFAEFKNKITEGWIGILDKLVLVLSVAGTESVNVKDSNGTTLAEGDAVTVIKDLKVKGSSITLKRGTLVESIRITDDPEAVECRVDGSTLVLKTCFLKKA